MESWAIESTYNSNNIEGSTLSLGDTALLYDGVQINGPEDDIRQAEGGFAALRLLRTVVADLEPLTEALIKRAHKLVFAEAKDPATRGAYRTVEVEITGTNFQPAPSTYVPERITDLVEMYSNTKRHPAIVAALFHLEFENIHPFVNTNGRTGRLMSNYLLMTSGFEPVNRSGRPARDVTARRAEAAQPPRQQRTHGLLWSAQEQKVLDCKELSVMAEQNLERGILIANFALTLYTIRHYVSEWRALWPL